mmetsp:Transcript_27520/g.83727  ORF Transcript_27520/g.83727 Transcript_27520/m.83727 type:complete len:212 (+) Transcript_27520:1182-1817(+)
MAAGAPGGPKPPGGMSGAMSPSLAMAWRSESSPFFAPSCMPAPFFTGLTKVGTGEAPPALKPLKASGTNGETPGVTSGVPAEYPPMPPPPMPPIAFAPFSRDIDFALRFISSCASRSLDWRIMMASFSSWESISMFVWISRRLRFSEWPNATTSSKANVISKAFLQTLVSSSSPGQYSERTCAKSLRVSRSSTMLECLLVIITRRSDSTGL